MNYLLYLKKPKKHINFICILIGSVTRRSLVSVLNGTIVEGELLVFPPPRNLPDVANFIKFRHLLEQKRGNWREQTKSWFEKYSPTFDIFPEFNGRDYYFTPQLLLFTLNVVRFQTILHGRLYLKFNVSHWNNLFLLNFPESLRFQHI